jgi:hypothetical protein
MVKPHIPIEWHYPRTALAQAYLRTLDVGLISSLVLFAPRRKGKTEFLLDDLLPAAEAAGYLTVYCSMWERRSDPLGALLTALNHPRLSRTFGAKIQQLPELFDEVVAASKGRVLIAFDEIQHLAHPEFEEFVAALRTCLDLRKRTVKTIFTGSSRQRLQTMFNQIKAPLFQFSQSTDFPDLDDEFVAFIAGAFQRATQRQLSLTAARAAFLSVRATPGLFHDAMESLMKSGGVDIETAALHVMEQARKTSGYAQRFASMRPLDREVMRAIVARMPLYTTQSRSTLAAAIGIDGKLSARQVQVAVNRLLSEQLIYQRGRGVYEIEDPQLAEWLDAPTE